jgi:hypothetical protein
MYQTKVVEKIKTHILRSTTFSRKSCRFWDNMEKYCRARQATDGNITRRMRFACWITKATDTHSEYVIHIAFPRQQWLRERLSMLLLYVYCLSCFVFRNVWLLRAEPLHYKLGHSRRRRRVSFTSARLRCQGQLGSQLAKLSFWLAKGTLGTSIVIQDTQEMWCTDMEWINLARGVPVSRFLWKR